MAVKIKRNPKPVPKDITGCTMVPLTKALPEWPKVQPGILANTYYRINTDSGELRCMVTVMPDGLRVAWDSCGKCHDTVKRCRCRSGIYHGRDIGWIRATYDHDDWPGVKILDYTEYYDPFGRRSGKGVERSDVVIWNRGPLPDPKPSTTRTEARKAKQKADRDRRDGLTDPNAPVLSVKDIENLTAADMDKAAVEQVKAIRRIVRRKAK